MKSSLPAIAVLLGVTIGGAYLYLNKDVINVQTRFRVTLEVQDGDQIKSGTSVVEVHTSTFRNFATGSLDYRNTPVGYPSKQKILASVIKDCDLAARFGEGVILKRVTVEITNDSVTPQPTIWPQWFTDKRMQLFLYGP
jgi:hypothetical protein